MMAATALAMCTAVHNIHSLYSATMAGYIGTVANAM